MPRLKTPSGNNIDTYYRVWLRIVPIQNDCIKFYICTTKIIEKLTARIIYVRMSDIYVM